MILEAIKPLQLVGQAAEFKFSVLKKLTLLNILCLDVFVSLPKQTPILPVSYATIYIFSKKFV